MDPPPPRDLVLATRESMITDAKRIIDSARDRGIVLRLIGGLAVRLHCDSLDFCEREHGDIDLVGHRRDANRLAELFAHLGFEENVHVREATAGGQLQFARERDRRAEWEPYGGAKDDHIDVFLDTFRMEHALDLSDRLALHDYTISASDLLLSKIQMPGLTDKDERDVLTLLQDLELDSAGAPDSIDATYIARLCAEDWGLYHDVTSNLARLAAHLDTYPLGPGPRTRILAKIAALDEAIQTRPKTRKWRLRAWIGTRIPWHDQVEEEG